ncbi:prestin-like isoform X2 [Dysidea avara]|uniref:prestin-like isoform X2 n=1 Tax=Dysidea avara TaxID=196820 RepID=UPI003322F718
MSAPSGEVIEEEEEPATSGKVTIDRPTYDELQFEETFHPLGYQRLKLSIPEPIRSHLIPPLTLKEWKEFLLVRLPILRWLWEYRHPSLFGDVISGVTVGIMHIPQGMAYAVLANVPPVYGLYVSFLPPMVYSLFGTSRQISIGTLAITCLMVGNAQSKYIHNNPSLCEVYNETTGENTTSELYDCPAALDVVFTITFVTGLIMIVFGALQFGFITIFLSDALVSGYTTGAAVHVFSSQLRHIVGLSSSAVKVEPGLFQLPQKWFKILQQVFSGNTNWTAVIITVLCITFLIIMKVVNKQFYKIRLYRKVPIPIPSQLIVVIVATAISAGFSLHEKRNIIIVDHIPTGLPPFTPPKPSYMFPVLLDSFIIAVVSYSIAISLSKVFANKHGYTVVPNQEFLAHGITNFVTSFFSCFVSTGSLSRSVIQDTTGGNTQLVSFISSSILIVVLLWVGPLFEPLPTAVLASVIVVALYGMFKQVKDIRKYYKLCVPDMMVWIVVFIATVLLGVDVGLVIGIEFSLFLIIMRLVLPTTAVLGKAGDTEIYRDQLYFKRIHQIPGVLIFRFIAPLCYTNVSVFKSRLSKASGIDPALCGNKEQKKGCLQLASSKIAQTLPSGTKFRHRRLVELDHHDDVDDDVTIETNHVQGGVQLNLSQSESEGAIHSIVLDMSPVSFIDSAGANTIKYIVSRYSTCNVQVLLAATTKNNREMLIRSGFMDEFGKEWLFPSIEDAATFAARGKRVVSAAKRPLFKDDASNSQALQAVASVNYTT